MRDTILIFGTVSDSFKKKLEPHYDILDSRRKTPSEVFSPDEIAKVPGVHAIFAASSDLGNFAGYKQGDPDYEREINIVHDAAIKAGIKLCGPWAWKDRPDFTCFQAGSETAAIARGVAAELGNLKDTQGKPEVGPYAPKK